MPCSFDRADFERVTTVPIIEIKDLTFQYANSGKAALEHIHMTVEKGDFIGIIGNSGAGKSTLTYSISGVVPHHYRGDFYGEVRVAGMDTVEVRPEQLSRVVGSVFQDVDAQMVAAVVEDELLFGLENFGVPKAEIADRMQTAMEQVGITDLKDRSIASLSGGQKQKVAVAAILALQPEIIVLDEPTGELDPVSSRQLFEILRELNQQHGITILIVEQKIMLLCEYVKRLAVMEDGRLLYFDEVRRVLDHSAELRRIGIHVPRIVSLKEAMQAAGLPVGMQPVSIPQAKAMVEEVLSCSN